MIGFDHVFNLAELCMYERYNAFMV